MNIREPHQYAKIRAERQTHHRHQKLRRYSLWALIGLLILSVITYGAYLRPLPKLKAKTVMPIVATEQVALSWPAKGQSAIGVQGQGVMAETDTQKAVPTASVAKVMLALAVLKKQPLQPGQAGPTLTLTATDVALFNKYQAIDGAVVKVVAGEQISLYQALQATLIPSGNNMADTLAIWAYGSMADYHTTANQLAQEYGMANSKFAGDASGFLPETVSTAHDLVLLGQKAMDNPVIKEIVAQPTAEVPVAGLIRNTNFMLGQNGIIGIKSGNTEQAGGCFLFAAERSLPTGQRVTVIGAIMGAPTFVAAATGAVPLLNSFYGGFAEVVVVPKNTEVARYSVPWGGQTTVVTSQDTSVLTWRGSKISTTVQAAELKTPTPSGSSAGSLLIESPYGKAVTPIVTTQAVSQPTWQWRIIRR